MRPFIIFIIFIMGSNMRKLVGKGFAGKGRPDPGVAWGSLLMVLRGRGGKVFNDSEIVKRF